MTDRLRKALAGVSAAATAFSAQMTDYDALLEAIVTSCSRALDATCTLGLFSADGVTITPVALSSVRPTEDGVLEGLLRQPRTFAQSLVGQLAPGSGSAFVSDIACSDLRAQVNPETYVAIERFGVRGFISITMRVRGEALGVLTVLQHDTTRAPLDDFDREIAAHLANLASFALANARLFRRAQDELAGRLSAEQVAERTRTSELRAVQANAFIDAILENIPAMVFVKDADQLAFVRFNRAGEQLLGIPRNDLIGKTDFDLFPKDEAEFFVAKDRETLRNQRMVDIPEEPIETAGGTRWLHTRKVPILDEHGESRYLLGISHDITDHKRDMVALVHARDAAEAASSELEAFSYSVAHDLRAPLRAIDGFSQALLDELGDELGETGRGYAHRVRSSAQRMGALIDDLLRLSRVTRSPLHRERLDLGELLRTTIAALQRDDPDRRVEIVTAGELVTHGDPRLLAIMFDNLAGNAWKFTSRRAGARIALSSEDRDGERVFSIADNGVGFDMAYVDKLFGVFHRLHADSDFPGTGVGLATVQRVVARHGGRVWARGEVGIGATFSFTLGDTKRT
ncbi:MAG: ATP-binding protein [Kofleriaceae bacterium]